MDGFVKNTRPRRVGAAGLTTEKGRQPMTSPTRRDALRAAGIAAISIASPTLVLANARIATPSATEGPFYPTEKPLDSDADLVRVNGRARFAQGQETYISGRVLDLSGRPIDGARVEIWQCDANGVYHHPRERRTGADPNFQGFGATVSDGGGAYRFRTIRPVRYPGRTPHIHFAVIAPGGPRLVTQMYVAGEAQNATDFVYRRLGDPARQRAVTVDLKPSSESSTALQGRFDIVLGWNAG